MSTTTVSGDGPENRGPVTEARFAVGKWSATTYRSTQEAKLEIEDKDGTVRVVVWFTRDQFKRLTALVDLW